MDSRRHRADNSISETTPHHDSSAPRDDLDPTPNHRPEHTDARTPAPEPNDRPPRPTPADETKPDRQTESEERDPHSSDRSAEPPSTDAPPDPFASYSPELRAHMHHDDTLSRLQYLSNPLPEPDLATRARTGDGVSGEPGDQLTVGVDDEPNGVVDDSGAAAQPEPATVQEPTTAPNRDASTPSPHVSADSTEDRTDDDVDSGERIRVGGSETEEHAVADEQTVDPVTDDSSEAATDAAAPITKPVEESDGSLDVSDRLSNDGDEVREGIGDQLDEADVPATTVDRARHWQELGYDPAIGKFRQGEAETAVRIESERDVRLERAQIDESYDWIDSHGRTYDAVGNFSARYLDLQWDHFKTKVEHHLEKADFVPIDVAKFTPEQRERIHDTFDTYYPRVFIVGDEESDGRND